VTVIGPGHYPNANCVRRLMPPSGIRRRCEGQQTEIELAVPIDHRPGVLRDRRGHPQCIPGETGFDIADSTLSSSRLSHSRRTDDGIQISAGCTGSVRNNVLFSNSKKGVQ
jgi:hypothetical protein